MSDRPIGFAKHNGCGEIIFRQAGHPSNDPEYPWEPVWLDKRPTRSKVKNLLDQAMYWSGTPEDRVDAILNSMQAYSWIKDDPKPEVTHCSPLPGRGTTSCCGRNPLELPRTDRMTNDISLVTCGAK